MDTNTAMNSEPETDSPMPRLAAKLEAILYVKAQPLSIQLLAEIAGCDREDIEGALIELMQDYVQRDSALEIAETDAGYSLQLKDSFQSLANNLVPTDLGVGALRTLAAIALKGPIAQTDLVELRGSGAYQHVQELVERGLVQKRRQASGRSFKVQVTDQFYQYFEVDQLPPIQGYDPPPIRKDQDDPSPIQEGQDPPPIQQEQEPLPIQEEQDLDITDSTMT